MKKLILAALKAKFEGVSEAILSRIADKLANTVTSEEAVTTAVEGVTFQQVIESYGDSRATEASESAVMNYEKKYGLEGGKPKMGGGDVVKPGEQNEDDDSNTPSWAKSLIASNKALADKVATMEGEKISSQRKVEFDAIINALPEDQRKGYGRTAYAGLTDDEFIALKSDVTAEVAEIVKSNTAKGAVYGRPTVTRNPGEKEEVPQNIMDYLDNKSGSGGQAF